MLFSAPRCGTVFGSMRGEPAFNGGAKNNQWKPNSKTNRGTHGILAEICKYEARAVSTIPARASARVTMPRAIQNKRGPLACCPTRGIPEHFALRSVGLVSIVQDNSTWLMIGGPGRRNPKQFEIRLASLAGVTRNILTYTWLAWPA